MIVLKLLMLVRTGKGGLCYSPPFIITLLFVKGAWSCEWTGQLAALKTVSNEGMTDLGRQKMGAGSVMWMLMWPPRRCPYLPYIWTTLWSFLGICLGSFQSSMGQQGWAMFSTEQIIAHAEKGNLKRLQTNNVWRLKKNWLQMTRQNHQHDSGSSSKAFRSYRITESQSEGTQKDQVQSLMIGSHRDRTHICRSGLAVGLPCSFTQDFVLFPPNKGGGTWRQLEVLWCFSGSAGAVVLQLSFGKHVAPITFCAESQTPQLRLISLPPELYITCYTLI